MSTSIVDVLCDFVEIAIHNILHTRKLYPANIFVQRKKYGIPVYKSVHPQLNEYILETMKAVKFHAINQQLRKIFFCISSERKVVEKHVFEILNIQQCWENDPLFVKLEQHFRTYCLKLNTCNAYLKELPEDAEFVIHLLTTQHSSIEFNENSTFSEFPWIQIDRANSVEEISEIVPIHTIDLTNLIIQTYVIK